MPQVRVGIESQLDSWTFTPEVRERRLEQTLFKIKYWQRRNASAAKSHVRSRLLELAALGIDLQRVKRCPPWPLDPLGGEDRHTLTAGDGT